jgi:hypothetical protein
MLREGCRGVCVCVRGCPGTANSVQKYSWVAGAIMCRHRCVICWTAEPTRRQNMRSKHFWSPDVTRTAEPYLKQLTRTNLYSCQASCDMHYLIL